MKSFVYFLILFAFFTSCCKNNEDCPRSLKTFWTLSPIKEVYKVGDTISVSSKFSRYLDGYNLFGKYLGKFDLEGILWKPGSVIWRIDTTFNDNSEFSLFDIEVEPILDTAFNYKIFHYSNYGNGLVGEYNYVNDTFNLEYKFVFTKKGLYLLENGSSASSDLHFQYFTGLCRSEPDIDVRGILNEGFHNNAYLLYESPDTHFSEWMTQNLDDRFYRHGMYCFRVVE